MRLNQKTNNVTLEHHATAQRRLVMYNYCLSAYLLFLLLAPVYATQQLEHDNVHSAMTYAPDARNSEFSDNLGQLKPASPLEISEKGGNLAARTWWPSAMQGQTTVAERACKERVFIGSSDVSNELQSAKPWWPSKELNNETQQNCLKNLADFSNKLYPSDGHMTADSQSNPAILKALSDKCNAIRGPEGRGPGSISHHSTSLEQMANRDLNRQKDLLAHDVLDSDLKSADLQRNVQRNVQRNLQRNLPASLVKDIHRNSDNNDNDNDDDDVDDDDDDDDDDMPLVIDLKANS